jgi:hypothetical protein
MKKDKGVPKRTDRRISPIGTMPKEIFIGQYKDKSKSSGWTASEGWFTSCEREWKYVPVGSERKKVIKELLKWNDNEMGAYPQYELLRGKLRGMEGK